MTAPQPKPERGGLWSRIARLVSLNAGQLGLN
jgi:hypothetical protein